ncbi:MAG: triose-phosphate isomerase [Candidatus Paceibacterota bacterium]
MKKIIVFNFKSFFIKQEVRQKIFNFFNNLDPEIFKKYQIILAPHSYYFLEFKKNLNQKILFSGQNIFWLNKFPCTGETTPWILKDLKIKYSIIGHSERKIYLKENEEMVNLKLKACFSWEIIPIICCGEEKRVNDFQAKKNIFNQLNEIFKGINLKGEKFIIAYEPFWAIGTGKLPSPLEIKNRLSIIRFWLERRFNEKVAQKTPLLYGGSVSQKNIELLLKEKEINGVLIGSLSTKINFLEKLAKKILK